jgi:hypothetical protein
VGVLSTRIRNLDILLYFITSKQWLTQEFFSGGSTDLVEDRRQREHGSRDGSPLVRGSTQFANE